jgi:hypothetical protein
MCLGDELVEMFDFFGLFEHLLSVQLFFCVNFIPFAYNKCMLIFLS